MVKSNVDLVYSAAFNASDALTLKVLEGTDGLSIETVQYQVIEPRA